MKKLIKSITKFSIFGAFFGLFGLSFSYDQTKSTQVQAADIDISSLNGSGTFTYVDSQQRSCTMDYTYVSNLSMVSGNENPVYRITTTFTWDDTITVGGDEYTIIYIYNADETPGNINTITYDTNSTLPDTLLITIRSVDVNQSVQPPVTSVTYNFNYSFYSDDTVLIGANGSFSLYARNTNLLLNQSVITPNSTQEIALPLAPFDNEVYYNAYNEGYQAGYAAGNNSGYYQGYSAGYQQGVADENVNTQQAYQQGYAAGFNEGQSVDSTASTIFSGILQVALVPINFFLGIFNFEILGINIRAFIQALFTIAITIIIIRMFMGGKSGE